MSKETSPSTRILTGMRPSGDLHLGHYAGALGEWKEFEAYPDCECIFLIADIHTLGDYSDDIGRIVRSVRSVATDWMAVGLDPTQSHFSLQSAVPETSELTFLLAGLMKKSELDRNPTLKSEMKSAGAGGITLGFYMYPAGQVADILVPRANQVPVGEDQIPHIEFTRKVANRFNTQFGEVFPIPNYHLSDTPRLVGTDGSEKMSKSRGNCIHLSDSPEVVQEKVMGMYTDPNHIRVSDPGSVEGNPVFMYLRAFDPDSEGLAEMEAHYQRGGLGDVVVKKRLIHVLNDFLAPIRARRAEIEADPGIVEEAIRKGTLYERSLAQETIQSVRDAMGLWQV